MTPKPKRPSIYEVSRSKHRVQLASDWRYFAFFRLLQISTSYWYVHLMESGQQLPEAVPLDLEMVVRTYRRFGEVWSRPYWDWWFDVGQYAFGTDSPPMVVQMGQAAARTRPSPEEFEQMNERIRQFFGGELRAVGWPAAILLSIPLNGGKKAILKQIEAVFDQAVMSAGAPRTPAPFQLLRNKIRDETVDQAIRAVVVKAEYPHDSPFALGDRANFSPNYVTTQNREGMAQIVSRHLLHAYRLAENSVRGRYPSLAALPDEDTKQQKFDYDRLRDQLRDYARLSAEALRMLPPAGHANEEQFAGSNRTIRYEPGLMKELQNPGFYGSPGSAAAAAAKTRR